MEKTNVYRNDEETGDLVARYIWGDRPHRARASKVLEGY